MIRAPERDDDAADDAEKFYSAFYACLVQFAHNNCKMFTFVQPQKSTTPKPMLLCEEGQMKILWGQQIHLQDV